MHPRDQRLDELNSRERSINEIENLKICELRDYEGI